MQMCMIHVRYENKAQRDNDTHLSFVVRERYTQIRHSSENGHQRLNRVAVHNRSVLFEIVRRETTLVNDSAGIKIIVQLVDIHKKIIGSEQEPFCVL